MTATHRRFSTLPSALIAATLLSLCATAFAQAAAPNSQDATSFDPDGAAHITRVIPMPNTVSPEAQQWLASLNARHRGKETLEERRAYNDKWRTQGAAEALKNYPVTIEETTTAGVRTAIITPLSTPPEKRKLVLINLHGGGFNADSGSLLEGDPIANLAKIKVVSVYYRLAPEHPFPAAVDDAVAVYRELLKTYQPRNIGIYGTSAGAALTGEVAVRLKQLGLPLPGALGIFSGGADFSRSGESRELYTVDGFSGLIQPFDPQHLPDNMYVGKADPKDPVLSPVYADLHGLPPTLLVTSTRDILLSDTALFHRALLRSGNDAQLVVFEALPHAFWYHFEFPETKEALGLMAKFFSEKLGH